MEIILAENHGFCYGVKRLLKWQMKLQITMVKAIH